MKPGPRRSFALGLFLIAWFLYFSHDVVGVHFAPDDMMNADNFYWSPGPWRLFYSQFLLWRGYYRPMGGLFYLPVLLVSGLNPAPYHVVLSLILLVNVWLVYRLAAALGAEGWAPWLAALAACYHAGLANLYYNTAFAYDALCGCFFFAALTYYFAIRRRGDEPNVRQLTVFGLITICALNSKEMALTLPGITLAYEWIYRRPACRGWREVAGWLRGPGAATVVAAALVLLDFYGKVFGVDALTGMAGYRPVFSWERFVDYQKTFLHDAAFLDVHSGGVLLVWLAISYLAWRPGARWVLRFCWFFLILTPLPIEFLPGKSQACSYIPAMGLAIFAAVVAADLADALGGALKEEPIFRRLGRPAVTAFLVIVVVFCWGRENERRKQAVRGSMDALGAQTWRTIEQLRALDPHVRPHSHVVFLHDPFSEWDMLFIADLWFRDRSVTVHIQRLTPLPPEELDRADTVFDYRDGQLMRLR